jgi:4-amino-4-deoxy-L-arabinose transferase-like glycosyltransferase
VTVGGRPRGLLWPATVLLLLTAFVCLPVWILPDWEGTEGRRVQIAREMAAAGEWLVPTLGGEPTWAKPPLHYWLLMVSERCFGTSRGVARLPSVLSIFAAAMTAFVLLRRRHDERTAWLGAGAILTSPVVLGTWPTAEIDPGFAALTAMSLWWLASGIADPKRAPLVGAGVFGGLALLHKGPPYFLFAAGALVVWWRERRCRGLVFWLLPMLAVWLAYYVPLWLLRIPPAAMLAVASEESVGRVAFYEWKHLWSIPGYWLRVLAVLLPFGAFWWQERRVVAPSRTPAAAIEGRVCLWSALLAAAVLTVFPGRSTRYLLPSVLLFVFALAPAAASWSRQAGPLPRLVRRALFATGVAGALALVILPWVPRVPLPALGLAAMAAVLPMLATNALRVVLLLLVLPVVGIWTLGLDRSLRWPAAPRARGAAGAVLAVELQRLGVDPVDLRTAGHIDSPLLLAAGLLPAGNESGTRPWTSRWVFHEYGTMELTLPATHVERMRLHLPFKSFGLRERRGGPR